MNEEQRKFIAKHFRNTPLGIQRIKRNLGLSIHSDSELEIILKNIILSTSLDDIETTGKNHYFTCAENNSMLTINSKTLTIITAKQIDRNC